MSSLNQGQSNTYWTRVIRSRSRGVALGLSEAIRYRDLIGLFVRRDLVTIYKQTILGPVWLVLQPILTSIAFMVVFGNLAGITTGGYPKFIFYYSGLVMWSLFAETFQKVSDTFMNNGDLFSKVFFPRLVMPLAIVATALIKFAISLVVFFGVWIWYYSQNMIHVDSFATFLWLPVLCLLAATAGMAFGLVFCSLTTRYRDFRFLIQFGIQLLMYFSPVIFPLSLAGNGWLASFMVFNPMTGIIESSRSVMLNGTLTPNDPLLWSAIISVVFLFLGLIIFSRVQKNFIDTL